MDGWTRRWDIGDGGELVRGRVGNRARPKGCLEGAKVADNGDN